MKYITEYKHKKKDFEKAWHIEKDYLEPSTIAGINQTIRWDKKNPDIHIFIRDCISDKIVGEATLLPLTKEQFDKFITGTLEDTEINEHTLLNYKPNLICYLLFSAIAIDKNYRNEKIILSLLLKGIYEKILYLMTSNIKFLNMCAEG